MKSGLHIDKIARVEKPLDVCNDVKVFSKNEKALETLIQKIRIYF